MYIFKIKTNTIKNKITILLAKAIFLKEIKSNAQKKKSTLIRYTFFSSIFAVNNISTRFHDKTIDEELGFFYVFIIHFFF